MYSEEYLNEIMDEFIDELDSFENFKFSNLPQDKIEAVVVGFKLGYEWCATRNHPGLPCPISTTTPKID